MDVGFKRYTSMLKVEGVEGFESWGVGNYVLGREDQCSLNPKPWWLGMKTWN